MVAGPEDRAENSQVPETKGRVGKPVARWVILASALALVGAAAIWARNGTNGGEAEGHSRPLMSSPIDESARFPWQERGAAQSLVPLDEMIPGGPPPDGIPAIDSPSFEAAEDAASWLAPQEPVVALRVSDDSRAYPIRILMWHEIVNDVVGGEPVSVTYCPLCDSATVYSRKVGDLVLDFGTSGRLYKSNLVMYDRQTKSLWPQLEGRAVAGRLSGRKLEIVPSVMLSFREWREANPTGRVLSRSTGFSRPYGRNPYAGYDEIGSEPFLYRGPTDTRLPAVERVIGLEWNGEAKAYPFSGLRGEGRTAVHDVVGGLEVVVFFEPSTGSALDGHDIAAGRSVGAASAYRPFVGDLRLTFEPRGGEIVDKETSSTWNLLGEAVEGELKGKRLEAVEFVPTFWFSWVAFRPHTTIWSGGR